MNRDTLIADIYAAAAGRATWSAALHQISKALGLWSTQIIGVDKQLKRVFLSEDCGSVSPQGALDYVRSYHSINPRVGYSLLLQSEQWLHDHEVFDERFVAQDPFYQEYLLPYGGRYLSGTKLLEDDSTVFLIGAMRGAGSHPLGAEEIALLESLRLHFVRALENYLHIRQAFAELHASRKALEPFEHPMFLIDKMRSVWYRNTSASRMAANGEVFVERSGQLRCVHHLDDMNLAAALDELESVPCGAHGEAQRRTISLARPGKPSLVACLSGISPERSMKLFSQTFLALLVVYDPLLPQRSIDPAVAAECFSLTPAEAKVAARLAGGLSIQEIAEIHHTSANTVKFQVQRVLEKTDTRRQSELVRLLLALPG